MYLLEGETLSYSQLQQQFDVAVKNADELQETNKEIQARIDELYVDMASDYGQFQATIEEQDRQLQGLQTPAANSGRTVEEVSARHARRNMHHFKSSTQQALRFAHTYGLITETLQRN